MKLNWRAELTDDEVKRLDEITLATKERGLIRRRAWGRAKRKLTRKVEA